VQQDIAAGILVVPFGFFEDGSVYDLLSPHPPGSDRGVAVLLEWLRDQSRESVWNCAKEDGRPS
jgi:hypothetical protein